VLRRVKEETNYLHELDKRKANLIGNILRGNCLIKHIIEGNVKGRIDVTGRRGKRRKQLLNDFKGKRGCRKLK
jgi:hypothetical protein